MREIILVRADWCTACHAMESYWWELHGYCGAESRVADVADADVQGLGICSLPTVLLRENGVVLAQETGARTKTWVQNLCDRIWPEGV